MFIIELFNRCLEFPLNFSTVSIICDVLMLSSLGKLQASMSCIV